jgi:hypothetical protein
MKIIAIVEGFKIVLFSFDTKLLFSVHYRGFAANTKAYQSRNSNLDSISIDCEITKNKSIKMFSQI